MAVWEGEEGWELARSAKGFNMFLVQINSGGGGGGLLDALPVDARFAGQFF